MNFLFSKKFRIVLSSFLLVMTIALLFIPFFYNGFFDTRVSPSLYANDESNSYTKLILAAYIICCLVAAAVIYFSQKSPYALIADIGALLFLSYEPLKGYIGYRRSYWPDTALSAGFYIDILFAVLVIAYVIGYYVYSRKSAARS